MLLPNFISLPNIYGENKNTVNTTNKNRYKKAFDAAAQKGIAIEINVFPLSAGSENAVEKLEEDIRMFLLAKECGCKFIFGSDAHIISEHKYFSDADKISDILGLTEEDIAEKAR